MQTIPKLLLWSKGFQKSIICGVTISIKLNQHHEALSANSGAVALCFNPVDVLPEKIVLRYRLSDSLKLMANLVEYGIKITFAQE